MDLKFMPNKKLSKEELEQKRRLRQQRHLRRVEKIRAQHRAEEVKKGGKKISDEKLAEIQRHRRHQRILARIKQREELEDAGFIILRNTETY